MPQAPSPAAQLRALRAENAHLRRRLDRTEARERERQGLRLERLERAVHAAGSGVFDWIDTAADEIYFTPAAYAVLGYEAYSFIPGWRGLLARVHVGDRVSFEREVRRAIYERGLTRAEVRIAGADGAYRQIEFVAEASVDAGGEVTRLVGALRDLGRGHGGSAELARLHERLALVIRGTGAGVWDWPDMTTDEVFWSPELLRLLGYDAPAFEMTTEVYWSLIHPEDVAAVHAAIEGSRERGIDFEVEYRIRFRDRGYRWVRSAGALVRDARGRPRRLTGAIVDVHEAELTRRELQAAAEGYARLRDLSQGQLLEPLHHVEAICDLLEEEGVASLDGLAYLTTMRMSAQRARLVAGAMAQG